MSNESENESVELEELDEEKLKMKYDEIYPLGVAVRQSSEDYRMAGYGLMADLPLLPDDIFWSLVEKFRIELIRKLHGNYGYIVKHAIQNMCCKLSWEKHSNVLPIKICENKDIGFATMILMFSKTWEQKGRDIAVKIDGEEDCRGDDSWSDYLDSIPLIGKQLYADIMEGKYPANKENELRAATRSIMTVKLAGEFSVERTGEINYQRLTTVVNHVVRSIFEGENYFASEISKRGFESLSHACWLKHKDDASE